MSKQIPLQKNNTTIELSFHDVAIIQQGFNFLNNSFKKWFNYLIIFNLYSVFVVLIKFYKQINGSLWVDYLKDYLKWWSIIYFIPLIGIGIILPACLTTAIHISNTDQIGFYLWASWIGIGCLFALFITPYSLLTMLAFYRKNLLKKYEIQIKKMRLK